VNQETQVFFNKAQCDARDTTDYILTLVSSGGVSNAYLWVAEKNNNCQESDSRNDIEVCAQLPNSQPQIVDDNGNIPGLLLSELLATNIVDCDNGVDIGIEYELYAFRNEPPGTNLVLPADYGVAEFTVDVVAPTKLTITSAAELTGSSFTIVWNKPSDSANVPRFNVYQGSNEDGSDVNVGVDTPVATSGLDSDNATVNATTLGLGEGESTYLFVTAVDDASVNVGDGNESELSDATLAVFAATAGFCDDPAVDCSGCSVSPWVLANGQPSSGLWVVGLVFAIVVGWRLRR
jgi:hypothetical protein